MKLIDVVKSLDLEIIAGRDLLDREVTGGYVSDILSSVLTNAEEGSIWVTYQKHLNIIPIASARDLSAVIVVSGRKPDKETLKKADAEKIPVLGTPMEAFQVVGKLYQLGIRGSDENV